MPTGLENLLAEGVVSEVLARLKSGKEAEVYVVRYGNDVVAAKVYKDRAHRSFKNNADYKEGRSVRNTRSQRAMARGSKFGRATSEDAWKTAEVDALYKLHAAGVRVPTPVMYLEGVLLMELVLDADGQAASRVIDIGLTPAQANAAYRDMLAQLVRILSCDLIHGDLSPYNVLWAAGGPTIIDFPQIVSASHNSSSEAFFMRDARNILGYFASIDRSLLARSGDAQQIWRAYVRRELTPEFMPSGRAPAFVPRPRAVEAAAPSRPVLSPPSARNAAPPPRGSAPSARNAAPPPRGSVPSARNAAPSPGHGPPPRHRGPPPRRPPQGPEVFVRVHRNPPPPVAAGGEPASEPAARRKDVAHRDEGDRPDGRLVATGGERVVRPSAGHAGGGEESRVPVPGASPANPSASARRRRRRRR
jgi:RIO kinase 1